MLNLIGLVRFLRNVTCNVLDRKIVFSCAMYVTIVFIRLQSYSIIIECQPVENNLLKNEA